VTDPEAAVRDALDDAYRREWAQVLATTVRVTSDLDLAEECCQDAFLSALTAWTSHGIPAKPGAWLTVTARRKALDQLRRASTARAKLPLLIQPESVEDDDMEDISMVADDRLRLVFTCCHPALSPETQVALTLRLVCGLPTADIARSFLVNEATMAARITRGKKKIQVARIPYAIPGREDLAERLDTVLTVIYLFFTAGHTRTSGDTLVDAAVVTRSIDLARMLDLLIPREPEVQGLLALLLLTDARSAARVSESGDLVLLPDQDRSLWNTEQIAEGLTLVLAAMGSGRHGRFTLQSAIAAQHAVSPTAAATNWGEIVHLYDELLELWPSPVVALNRSVAVAEVDGPAAALVLVEQLVASGQLDTYPYLWATKAEFERRLNSHEAASEDYRRALTLVGNDVERSFLQGRLRTLSW
jgi:RNA polymerase sigma-70 factor (ECF subfamily)